MQHEDEEKQTQNAALLGFAICVVVAVVAIALGLIVWAAAEDRRMEADCTTRGGQWIENSYRLKECKEAW